MQYALRHPRKDQQHQLSSLAGRKLLGGNCECRETSLVSIIIEHTIIAGQKQSPIKRKIERLSENTKHGHMLCHCFCIASDIQGRIQQHQLSSLAGRKLLGGNCECRETSLDFIIICNALKHRNWQRNKRALLHLYNEKKVTREIRMAQTSKEGINSTSSQAWQGESSWAATANVEKQALALSSSPYTELTK